MKRVIAAVVLLFLTAAVAFGYAASRRERAYRQLVDRGEAALAREDTSTAIAAFSGAIRLKGDSMLGYLKRGEAYRRRNELDAALDDLRRAADLDPLAPRPRELLGDVHYALATTPRAGIADDTGRFGRSADHYQACVDLDDRSPRVLYKLALARYGAGQPKAAVLALDKAVAIDDGFAEAYYLLGLCYRELRRPADALRALDRSVKLAPALLHAREELSDLYQRLDRHDDRIAQLEALRVLDPRPSRDVALGLAYARAGQSPSAVRTLGLAAERYPDHAYTYVALGRLWLEKAQSSHDRVDLNKALGALERAAANDGSSEALTLFGRALILARQDESAERVLRRAAEKLPVDPLAFHELAEVAERRGHLDVARRALLDADAVEGEDSDAGRAAAFALRVADLSMRSGEASVAVTWYQRAIGADPNPSLLIRLADAQITARQLEAARATIARVLQKDPANRSALALQERLR